MMWKPVISHVRPGNVAKALYRAIRKDAMLIPTARYQGFACILDAGVPFIILSQVGDVNGYGEPTNFDNVFLLTSQGMGWSNFESDGISRI